jgi:hypothetical protein
MSWPKFEQDTPPEYQGGTSPHEAACSVIRDGVGRYGGAETSDSVQQRAAVIGQRLRAFRRSEKA